MVHMKYRGGEDQKAEATTGLASLNGCVGVMSCYSFRRTSTYSNMLLSSTVFGRQHLINCKLGHAAGVEWKHLQCCGCFPNERSTMWGAKMNGWGIHSFCVSLCVHSFMTCCHLRTMKQSSNQLLPLDSRIQGSFIVIIVALSPVLFKFHIKPRQIKKI